MYHIIRFENVWELKNIMTAKQSNPWKFTKAFGLNFEESNILLKYKLQLFWEGHKYVRNRPYGFEIYLINIKTIKKIAQIFAAFLGKLNFIIIP